MMIFLKYRKYKYIGERICIFIKELGICGRIMIIGLCFCPKLIGKIIKKRKLYQLKQLIQFPLLHFFNLWYLFYSAVVDASTFSDVDSSEGTVVFSSVVS